MCETYMEDSVHFPETYNKMFNMQATLLEMCQNKDTTSAF